MGGTATSLSYDNATNLTADGDKEYCHDVLGRPMLLDSAPNSNVKPAANRYDAVGWLAVQIAYDYEQDGSECTRRCA